MILNPDGVWVATAIAGAFFATLAAVFLLIKKDRPIGALVAATVIIALTCLAGNKAESYFQRQLNELAQPAKVIYKTAESKDYKTEFHVTVQLLKTGCLADMKVKYPFYSQTLEGSTITVTPDYDMYHDSMQNTCSK
jgi:hypothetical protein|nr:MAG TPA: hypothetical protein [Herelleviridae sp.]